MFKFINKRKRAERVQAQLVRERTLALSLRYQDHALNLTTPGVTAAHKDHSIVVSLTSFDKRINDVHLCIESLFQQSLKADRIVLWLSRQDFPTEDLPRILRQQQQRGLEIVFHDENLGPHKKIHYALARYPESLILTVDDDTLYPADMIDLLYRAHCAGPDIIHCHKGHRIGLDKNGRVLPYKQWQRGTREAQPSRLVLPTGVGGVLYFPGCFDDNVSDKDAFMRLAPRMDDIWLKAMSLKKGTLCRPVQDDRVWGSRFLTIEGSQAHALKRKNKSKLDGNDIALKAVFDEYALWPELTKT